MKIMKIALVGLGAGLAAAGLALGQQADVWRKAALVCMECIGLG